MKPGDKTTEVSLATGSEATSEDHEVPLGKSKDDAPQLPIATDSESLPKTHTENQDRVIKQGDIVNVYSAEMSVAKFEDYAIVYEPLATTKIDEVEGEDTSERKHIELPGSPPPGLLPIQPAPYSDKPSEQVVLIDPPDHDKQPLMSPQTEESKVQESDCEVFDQKTTEAYRKVFNSLSEYSELPSSTDKCCKCCSNCCCVSLTCTPTCLSKGNKPERFKITSDALQKGSTIGWKMFGDLVTPLLHPIVRNVIVSAEFFLGAFAFLFSTISFGLGSNASYNAFHLALSIASLLLATLDFILTMKFCCFDACRHVLSRRKQSDSENQTNENEKQETTSNEKSNENETIPPILRRFWDISRIVIAEVIFYPLLICDLIELIVGKSYRFGTAGDGLNFLLFLYSIAALMFYVYVARLAVLVVLIYHLYKMRRLTSEQRAEANKRHEIAIGKAQDNLENDPVPSMFADDNESDEMNSKIATKGMVFQLFFFFHVAGQMAMQILMIAAIAIKIAQDNHGKTLDDPLHISGALWFMLVAGYIMPIAGIMSFFIATYYWVYEYPNGICINILSILETPGFDTILSPGENIKKLKKTSEKVAMLLNKIDLKKDFKELTERTCIMKFVYPFTSPGLVILCILYGTMQFAFIVVTIASIQVENVGVIFYYFLSVILGLIANAYVFVVGALWVAIIVGVLLIIAMIIICFVMFIILVIIIYCACNSSSQKNTHW